MDCDEERSDQASIDVDFLTRFSCMNTNEKDELVLAFQNIADDLSYTTARFFLDMNNWNLQAAVGCYFDFLASNQVMKNAQLPSMRIIKELTVGLGESVTKNTQFQQSWMIENTGETAWPSGCYLKLISEITTEDKLFIPPIQPNETTIVTVNLCSPNEIGQFRSQFCMCTPDGATFGQIIWSVVDVSESGTLALTQQLSKLHTSNSMENSGNFSNFPSFSANTVDRISSAQNDALLSNSGFNATTSIPFNNPIVQNPAPQNSPIDEEMMVEKLDSTNI